MVHAKQPTQLGTAKGNDGIVVSSPWQQCISRICHVLAFPVSQLKPSTPRTLALECTITAIPPVANSVAWHVHVWHSNNSQLYTRTSKTQITVCVATFFFLHVGPKDFFKPLRFI